MIDLPLTPLLGATIITSKAWLELPASQRAQLLAAANDAGATFENQIPGQERQAIAEMERRGLEILQIANGPEKERWRSVTESFAESMRQAFVPADFYDQALTARAAYRREQR